VQRWARANNLQLNCIKTKEIIFVDKRRKCRVSEPPLLPGITRVTSMTILGVTFTSGLSASDHVRHVISKSAQTIHALRVLRTKGMPDDALQVVFRSVIVGKLLYASSAWGGFVSCSDRKRVDAFLQRSKRCGFCPPNLLRFDELLEEADSALFMKVISDSRHVLHQLLPPPSSASQNYSLRDRTHQFSLPDRTGRLMDCNFLTRTLYKDVY